MIERIISISRMKRFAYCSMQSHFHDELRIPWWVKRAVPMMHYIVRTSLQYYFSLEMYGTRASNAERAMERMDIRLDRVRKRWGLAPEAEILRGDFNTAISLLHRTYNATTDTMLGGAVPMSFHYPYQVGGIDWTITHRVDAIFVRNRKVRGVESYVFLNVTDPMDPYDKRVRYGEIVKGYLSYVARDAMGKDYGLPIEVVDFPLIKPPTKQILYQDGRAEFDAFAKNALTLMATNAAIPTGDPVKCVDCPYTGMCKPSIANITSGFEDRGRRRRLRIDLKQNKTGMRIRRPTGD